MQIYLNSLVLFAFHFFTCFFAYFLAAFPFLVCKFFSPTVGIINLLLLVQLFFSFFSFFAFFSAGANFHSDKEIFLFFHFPLNSIITVFKFNFLLLCLKQTACYYPSSFFLLAVAAFQPATGF